MRDRALEVLDLLDCLGQTREVPHSSLSTEQLPAVPCEVEASCAPLTPFPRPLQPPFRTRIIVRNYSEHVDFVKARELPFVPVTSTSDLGLGGAMRLVRSPSPNLPQGPSVRKQFPLRTTISHTISCWCVANCLDRSVEPGIRQGRLKSICPYRAQDQKRCRYGSSLIQVRCLNMTYDRSTESLFFRKRGLPGSGRASYGQKRP